MSFLKEASSLPFCESKLAVLTEDQQKIYRGLYHALQDEHVRTMFQLIAKENGFLGRRFINSYITNYTKIMGDDVKN